MNGMAIRLFVPLFLTACQAVRGAGLEDFRFAQLKVVVNNENHRPVRDAAVKLYSKEWPLVYPHGDGFSRTAADGACTLRLPCGTWTIVAGGGTPFNDASSGTGLLIVKDVAIDHDTNALLEPVNKPCLVHFSDRSGRRAELDEIYAAPSCLVPNCLMPLIGNTKGGLCRIAAGVSQPITLFLVSKPTAGHPGYFLRLDRKQVSESIDCAASMLKLRAIHFDGRDSRDGPGPIEWVSTFPSLDLCRPAGHTAFRATGRADVYSNIDFLNCFFWVYFGDPQDWRYESSSQGIDLAGQPTVTLVAGGPLTANLRILSPSPINLTQFLFDPVDAHGNHIFWYFSTKSPLKIPIEVRQADQGPVLWSTTFDRHQNPGLQTDKLLAASSIFRTDWDLGPYGGTRTLKGRLDAPAYKYQSEVVTTTHFTVHAPAGTPEKSAAFADRLEAAYKVFTKWIGRSPPVTQARNFYIEPVGLWASAYGQELFQHGFLCWNPHDPAPIGWQSCCFHELGHRMELEHFTVDGRLIGPGGEKAEAFADLFRSLAVDELHGEQVGQFSRRGNADWFFDSLAERPGDETRKPRNVRFLVETYLPKRIGPAVTTEFFRRWTQAWTVLEAKGFNEDEACAALYSVLAGKNLWSLFVLCGSNSTEARMADAIRQLPADWQMP